MSLPTPVITQQKPNTNVASKSYLSDILLWQFNYHTKQFIFNANFLKEFGYSLGDLNNNEVWDTILTKSSKLQFDDFIQNPVQQIKGKAFEGICKNGSIKIFNLKIKVLEKFNKEYYNLLIGQLEILESKSPETTSSDSLFKNLIELDPHPKLILNEHAVVEYINPAFQQLIGMPANEIINKSFINLIDTAGLPELIQAKQILTSVQKGQPVKIKIRLKSEEAIEPRTWSINLMNGKMLVYTI